MLSVFVDRPSTCVWVLVLSMCTVNYVVDSRAIERVQSNEIEYLANYGYLGKAELETGALRSMAELEAAVRGFQVMAGLEQTGQLDQKTLEKMRAPRCGMADMNSTARGPQSFALGPSKWEKTDITYRIRNYTDDVSRSDVEDAVEQALKVWRDVSPLTFRKVTGQADIEISFHSGFHDDGHAFDGKGNVLAHAFPPGKGRGGDVHFDEDEQWTVRSQQGINLFMVAAHEFGHSLGIYHSKVPGALMYPWYQGYVPELKLSQDDINAVQALYGSHRVKPPGGKTPPTGSERTTVRPTIPSVRPTRPGQSGDEEPDPCSSGVDAVATIRSQIFAFKGKYFWRMDRNGGEVHPPAPFRQFWSALPEDITHIDAVYENQHQKIVFFKGNRFWEMDGTKLASGFPRSGKTLKDFGLDPGVSRVDAVFVWGHNRRTYLFSGYSYWRMNSSGTGFESGYPRSTDMWSGIPIPFDAVFTHPNGTTYFIKGPEYWSLNDRTMRAEGEYPKPLRQLWTYCSKPMRFSFANALPSSISTLVVSTVLAIVQLHAI